MNWNEALCKGQLDLFFDENPVRVQLAKQICSDCELERDCRFLAIQNKELYGVWGGTTYFERKQLAVELGMEPLPDRDPIEHGTTRGYDQHKLHGIPIENGDPCGCLEAFRASARERMKKYREKKRQGR